MASGNKLTPYDFAVFGRSNVEIGDGISIYGNIGTNTDSITIKPSYIKGDLVLLTVGEKQHRVKGDINSIKGKVIKLSEEVWLPSLKVPNSIQIKDGYEGEPLMPGVYAFKKLELKNNEIITTSDKGEVTIYVTEILKIGEYGDLQVGKSDIIIFGTKSLKDAEISGNKQFKNCTIYAPDAKIVVSGDVAVKGSIIGDNVIYQK
jgi:hypothetical protein